MANSKKLFIITGDYSGDKHALFTVNELKRQNPDLIIEGIGGINLQKAGIKLFCNQDKMNGMGISFSSVINHILLAKRLLSYLKNEYKPDLVLLIDYGGFNLRISEELKKLKIKTFYFIPPQIWASRPWRIKKIKKNIDRVFTIFPFEKEYYEKEGINSLYVGHPLLKELKEPVKKEEFFRANGLDMNKKLIGVFPGSRKFEIKFLFKIFEKAAKIIEKKLDNVQFVFSKSENLPFDIYKTDYKVLKGNSHDLLASSDFLILASGTVALEAALYKTPMLIAYRGPFLFYLIYLLVRTINKACLVNIITKKDIVPEFLMFDANPNRIAQCAIKYLSDSSLFDKQISGLIETRNLLGNSDCAKIVANEIIKELYNG